MELGLGIHGEPGASMSPLLSADAVVDALLASITSTAPGTSYLPLSPGDKVALLVNNLGGTTPIELSIAARRALQALRSPPYSLDVARAYCGPFMTALDMCGLSLSLMKLDENRLARLDAPAEPPAWPSEATPTPAADAVPLPPPALPESAQAAQVPRADESTPPVLTEGEQAAAMGAVRRAAEAVAALEPKLTEYDSKVCMCGGAPSSGSLDADLIRVEVGVGGCKGGGCCSRWV
jgi:dihydroxyacetone kinase